MAIANIVPDFTRSLVVVRHVPAAYGNQFHDNGIFRRYLRIMLAKFSDFNISEYALTNVTFSYKFAFKKMPYGRLSLRHLN